MNKWVVCIIALIIGMLMYHILSNVCGCSRVVEGQTINIQTPELKSSSNTIKKEFNDLLLKRVGTISVNEQYKINKEFMVTHRINNIVDHLAEIYHKNIDWSDKLGPISTLNTHADVCWAVSIIYTIKGAIVLSGIPETNNYEPSIQQLLDCTSDNPSDTYTDNNISLNLPFTIYNTYIKNSRQIYSESDYPTIINNCSIYSTDQGFVFCNHVDITKMNMPPSELGRGIDNYDEKYQVVACRGDIYDTCNDSKDISDPRGWGDNCWGHISDNGIKKNCSASGTDKCVPEAVPVNGGPPDGWYNDGGKCQSLELLEENNYIADNLQHVKSICGDNDNCEERWMSVKGMHLNCTTDFNNRCIQSCKIMDKQPKIFIDEIVHVINDDKHIFDALQNHVLACSILMVDELYPDEDYNDIEDDQLAYNNCRIDFDTPGVEDYIVDSCIYDFDGWTCGQYVDNNWCCINNCNNLPNWTDSQGMTCDDYEINNYMCTEEQKQNSCTANNIENYYNDPINADCCGAETLYNELKLESEPSAGEACCALGGGIRTNEENSISSKPTSDMTCNDYRFPIEGGYCMKEQGGHLRRITEIDGNNITSEEQCNQNNGQWINENFSGNYPDKDFCKDECQNNINNCNVNANHSLLIVGTDYYNDKYYWKIRNNWGNNWGHNGCFYLQRDIDSEGNIGRRNLFGINELVYYVTVKTDPN